jgi:hypothetical protein
VIGPGPYKSGTDIFESFGQRCFQKGFWSEPFFSHTGSIQNRCVPMRVFWRSARGHINPTQIFSTPSGNDASKRVSGRSPFSTDRFYSKPMCAAVGFLVSGPGPYKSTPNLFRIVWATMLSQRVSGRSPFFHKPVLFKTDVCRCELFG